MLYPGAVMGEAVLAGSKLRLPVFEALPLRSTWSLDSLISLSTVKTPFQVGCVQEGKVC